MTNLASFPPGPPEVCRLSHLELMTPDLSASLSFFRDVVGLEEISRSGDVAFLRAWGDTDDHSLVLSQREKAGVGHVSWRTRRAEDVERFATILRADGRDVREVAPGSEPGQGPAIRFDTPAGFELELFYERVVRPAATRSDLRTNSARAYDHGISPRRIDHINLAMSSMATEKGWYEETLGLRTRDYLTVEGEPVAAWLAASALHHEIGMAHETSGPPRGFHHLAYFLDGPDEVIRAATVLTEHGHRPQHVGRHAISQAMSLYVVDPGSGHRLELYSGAQLILDPDYPAMEWVLDGEYRQWWGPEMGADMWLNSPA